MRQVARIIAEFLLHLGVVFICLLAGTILVGGIGAIAGMLMARSYVRHGPSDPADAPVYVTMGLVFMGAIAGAIIGVIVGVALCVRLANQKKKSPSALSGALP
jgi:TRAP-type C4-dicarboxylate transport system permease small subunit